MKAMKQKQTEVFAEILANQDMIYACVMAILSGKDAPPPAQSGRRPAKKKRQSRVA